jgi:hypothetical protein
MVMIVAIIAIVLAIITAATLFGLLLFQLGMWILERMAPQVGSEEIDEAMGWKDTK